MSILVNKSPPPLASQPLWFLDLYLASGFDGIVLQNVWSKLRTASFNGHLDVMKTLIEAGANVKRTNKVCNVWCAIGILQCTFSQRWLYFTSYQDNTTPLYIASQEGHLDVVKTLLGAGSDIKITSDVSDVMFNILLYMDTDIYLHESLAIKKILYMYI